MWLAKMSLDEPFRYLSPNKFALLRTKLASNDEELAKLISVR